MPRDSVRSETDIDPETGDMLIYEDEPEGSQGPVSPDNHFDNLVDLMDDTIVEKIGFSVTEHVAQDESGRDEWEDQNARYIEALGVGPESEADDSAYEFSDTSDSPLLLTALTRFQAKALSGLMPSPDQVCRAEPDMDFESIEDPQMRKAAREEATKAARRVGDFYNDYLLAQLPAYVEDTDKILYDCGLFGLGVRRVFIDGTSTNTPVKAEYVPLEDLIFSYDTKNMTEGRIAHRRWVKTSDMVRCMQVGEYKEVDLNALGDSPEGPVREARDRMHGVYPTDSSGDGADHKIYDIYTRLFLSDDPHPMHLARPYVVTVHAATQKVLAVRRNWSPDDPDETPIENFVGYIYHPGKSAVSTLGLGALLTNLTLALRKGQRRGLDAAYLANHPSGFMLSGVRIRDDSTPIVPGELRSIEAAGVQDIRAAMMTQPFKGPDQGLLALMDRLEASAKELGGIASIDLAEMMKSGIAAGPALAAYDETTEFQTSVHRRLYTAHKSELDLVHSRMQQVVGNTQRLFGSGRVLQENDLLGVKLVPAMPPGYVSQQRQLMQASAVIEASQAAPEIIDQREAYRRYFEAMGVNDIDGVMVPDPEENPPQPADPVTEYNSLMAGAPIVAGLMQNHRAHIDAHTAQMKGLQSSNLPVETGQMMAATLAAHIAEHMGMEATVFVAQQLGIPPDSFAQGLPPEIEAEAAPMIAEAVQQLESSRAEEDQPDSRVVIEQMRSENKLLLEQMRNERERFKLDVDKELAALRERGQTYRNDTDNYWAVQIAKLREGKPPASPERPRAGMGVPRPHIGRQDMNP